MDNSLKKVKFVFVSEKCVGTAINRPFYVLLIIVAGKNDNGNGKEYGNEKKTNIVVPTVSLFYRISTIVTVFLKLDIHQHFSTKSLILVHG